MQRRSFEEGEKFIVLEGNRRVTALKELVSDKEADAALLKDIDPLEVVEVLGDASSDVVRAQITYLLGVRHHGSLVQWGAFAQAHELYERYLRAAGQTDGSFAWDADIALKVAKVLGVKTAKVEERIKVYRMMKQVDELPAVQEGAGGILGRYYSLCKEALTRGGKKSPLRTYINQDPSSFLLDGDSLERLNTICHFDRDGRADAPISEPEEWRPFEKILKDEDSTARDKMVGRVELGQEKPSNVYAERAAELRVPRWDRWLLEVGELLGGLRLDELEGADEAEAKRTITRLRKILDSVSTSSTDESVAP